MISTEQNDFIHTYSTGKTQLFWNWHPADLETPVSAYLKLCTDETHAFLLESVEGGKTLGRHSIIGLAPDRIWSHEKGKTTCTNTRTNACIHQNDTPLSSLRKHIASCKLTARPPTEASLPPMAVSGLFGYLGYDTIRWVEEIPASCKADIDIPEAILIRPSVLVIFDHVKNMMCIAQPVYNHVDNSGITPEDAYEHCQSRSQEIVDKLAGPIPQTALGAQSELKTPLTPTSNTPAEAYKSAIEKTVDYIHQGEIFQGVIAQRFETPFDLPPFDLYRTLRRANPSPFMFYVKMDTFSLVGSSPEILVRVRDNTVTIRPIAGTRQRGATELDDQALEQELLADEKERAEHLMLLDLGRNDVGRVSSYGSVKVTENFTIERYSHVMHIVSNVEGTLAHNKDSLDAFYAGFPAGTVSGAPKIRAMEIIDELEVSARKSYGGAVGYFSENGDIDTCIALRTGLVKDGTLYVQAGGGIVADSTAEFEHQESVNKAQAVLSAAQQAISLSQSQ